MYFAYGSNMWLEQMQERCPDHRIIGLGLLRGYRWIISARGYANIIRSFGDLVYGVVFDISGSDEQKLDGHEGVSRGSYRKELLSVEINDSPTTCLVYADPIEQVGEPKPEYVSRINNGVEDAELPSDYVLKYIRIFIPG